MAFCGISIPFSNPHFLILQNPSSPKPNKPNPPLSPSPFSTTTTAAAAAAAAASSSSTCSNVNSIERLPVHPGRRTVSLSISVGFLLSSIEQPFSNKAQAAQMSELYRYTDSVQGFTLLVPSSWIKVDKAGATALFEDENKKANNAGVVVSPIKISSLGEFGTPQFVADKLIQAERRKESTKEAEVISVSERSGDGGIQVYEFEYKVDSTRGGLKRVFSAAFITSKKLYLLNVTHSDALENPLPIDRRIVLEQVLHSFDSAPST
ncbi:hypothetical protein ABFS82_08G086100 [Erythranthe guttata]|uniref:PsbP C-terminal domain-containing protein n=1 Tax=Erythranthe guttata TaxID=4155 RepID=A0A022PYM3_ERYGU|nr:PREDICTED: psbP domain-containing protein 2, chloroplastic [Erythranthe guttata]EYU20599.1 hypothetical protein MIMGU_mgv1a012026mg [Erythranthe guttata]|eukprot:XP_012857646.1 PREDICTED: psbP domain-containing protein 2, chloroplastic [Erythranthe guttata]